MTPGHARFEVGEGVGIVGRGPDAASALVQTALGVFALIAEPGSLAATGRREVRAHGADLAELAVNWIGECLYVHDIEGFAACEVELVAFEAGTRGGGEPMRLHGLLHGQEVDASGLPAPVAISGVRRPALAAGPVEGGWEIRVALLV